MESSSFADVMGGRNAGGPPKAAAQEPVNQDELNDITKGEFRIESLKMKNGETGELLWEGNDWDLTDDEEQKVQFPSRML